MNMTKTNWNSTSQSLVKIIINCCTIYELQLVFLALLWVFFDATVWGALATEAKYLNFLGKKGPRLLLKVFFAHLNKKTQLLSISLQQINRWKRKKKSCFFLSLCGLPSFLGCLCSQSTISLGFFLPCTIFIP